MKILLMGPQGSGKGTIGAKLSEHLDIPLVSVGRLLRNMPSNHPKYEEVQKDMAEGELAPFETVAAFIQERISQPDCEKGFILDGWARSMGNLTYFDPKPDNVLVINIPEEESVRRICGRRMCDSDGKIYNIYTLPKEELKKCTGNLTQRDDDTEEAVKERLEIYYTETVEVIDHLKNRGTPIHEINGSGSPQEVFERALQVLN